SHTPHTHTHTHTHAHTSTREVAGVSVSGQHNTGVRSPQQLQTQQKEELQGAMVAGYACSADFSPEGSLVVSGDADGKLTVWEWRTTRIVTRFKAHDSVCISCLWLPHKTSKIISCGWDGKIHL
ncbi:Pre-mRNA-processing factor 17, partial [Geodia barretti]